MNKLESAVIGATAAICPCLGFTSGAVLTVAVKLKCRPPIVETQPATVILIVGR